MSKLKPVKVVSMISKKNLPPLVFQGNGANDAVAASEENIEIWKLFSFPKLKQCPAFQTPRTEGCI